MSYSSGIAGPGAMPFGTGPTPQTGIGRRVASAGLTAMGAGLLLAALAVALSLVSWSSTDPSLTHAASGSTRNWMGPIGAITSDLLIQLLGLGGVVFLLPVAFWGLQLVTSGAIGRFRLKLFLMPLSIVALAAAMSALPTVSSWPLRHGYGGITGDFTLNVLTNLLAPINPARAQAGAGFVFLALGMAVLVRALGLSRSDISMLLERRGTSGGFSLRSLFRKSETPPTFAQAEPIAPQQPAPHFPHRAPGYPVPMNAPAPHPSIQIFPPTHARPMPPPAHIYPNPFLRAHPMTAQNVAPLPARHHAPQHIHHHAPMPHPAPQHIVTPVVVVPVAMQQMPQPQPAPQPAAPMHPPAIAEQRPAIDMVPPEDPTFDHATEAESRAIAARFAPRDVLNAPPIRAPQPSVSEPDPHSLMPAAPQKQPVAAAPKFAAQPESVQAAPLPSSTIRRVAEMMAERRRPDAPAPVRNEPTLPDAAKPAMRAPSTALLKPAPAQRVSQETSAQTLRGLTKLLLDTLGDYGVKGEITAVRPGPVVTLFEFEPARGTKSSRVIGLADDIARSMSATAVRIAVIPGRNAIGIELPNVTRDTVYLRELIESQPFSTAGMKLPLALGRNIGGDPVIADLAKMPHLLVAGTTGSGKSVGVNAMILSLLYRLSPDECRLIMIDPKMLELSVYNDIPHLLAPVVTEPGKAVSALNWVVREMEDRYRRMARLAVRNIDAYNARLREQSSSANPNERTSEKHMPYIVVIIDEFADLMAVAGKEIEFAVQRLAQMARAAGIHLIMATQRPSVDVITGTIKANFPTRISFRVTSRIDSRTILNEHGAEQLLGQGDMLFTGGSGGTMRVHGPYVSDEEVETIATWLRANGTTDYSLDFADATEGDDDGRDGDSPGEGDEDDIYDRAVAVVVRDQKASTSYLQRRLSIGYNRAADLIERMERDGIIGPANHAGKRELLSPQGRRDD